MFLDLSLYVARRDDLMGPPYGPRSILGTSFVGPRINMSEIEEESWQAGQLAKRQFLIVRRAHL